MLKYSFFLALASCLVLTSCDQIEKIIPKEVTNPSNTEDGFTTYVIPENNHFTSNNFGLVNGSKLKFIAKFDESAEYINRDPANQADINKLYGFSDCGTEHQSNSARFGWRWYNNQLEILAYTYKDKVRLEKFITAVELNKEYEYELEAQDGKYLFKLDGKLIEMERGCNGNTVKYKLFPYFGGDETAPHDVTIQIKDLP